MSAVSGQTRTIDTLLALGAAPNASWRFVPEAVEHLDSGDRNPELLALLAAHAVRLGLRTLAVDALDALPTEFTEDPQVIALRDAARTLRPNSLAPERRVAIARANCDALGDAGTSLRASLDEWSRRVAVAQAFTTPDRNIALRDDPSRPFAFRILGDARSSARAAWKPSSVAADDPTGEPPVFIAGLRTPCLLERIIEGAPTGPTGYSPRIWVYEPDPLTALDALSFRDLRGRVDASQVRIFVGPDARARLEASLLASAGEHLPRVVTADADADCETDAATLLHEASQNQIREHERLQRTIALRNRSRDRDYYAARLESPGNDTPIRVLLATTRYSTVTLSAAEDLAQALQARGCDAELLIESDNHARLSSLGYLGAIERFDPDLIVLINYPRSMLASAIPEGVPCVTWVQDAMAHLFDPSLAAKATPLDFAVGVISWRMMLSLGLPPSSTANFPMVASSTKFHAGEVDPGLRSTLACEIAYAGHQSSTAESLRDSFRASLKAKGQRDNGLIDRILAEVRSLTDQPDTVWATAIRDLTRDALAECSGGAPSPAEVEHVVAMYTRPVADRLFRHQTLEWAAEIAERRGWRFCIHGAGWDRHPTLARFAKPAIEHGETLRTLYQSASVSLHASVTTMCHQRVFECALSGGFTLCRTIADESIKSLHAAVASAVRRKHPGRLPEFGLSDVVTA